MMKVPLVGAYPSSSIYLANNYFLLREGTFNLLSMSFINK